MSWGFRPALPLTGVSDPGGLCPGEFMSANRCVHVWLQTSVEWTQTAVVMVNVRQSPDSRIHNDSASVSRDGSETPVNKVRFSVGQCLRSISSSSHHHVLY